MKCSPFTILEGWDFLAAVPAGKAAVAAAAVEHTLPDRCHNILAAVPVGSPGSCTPLEREEFS